MPILYCKYDLDASGGSSDRNPSWEPVMAFPGSGRKQEAVPIAVTVVVVVVRSICRRDRVMPVFILEVSWLWSVVVVCGCVKRREGHICLCL